MSGEKVNPFKKKAKDWSAVNKQKLSNVGIEKEIPAEKPKPVKVEKEIKREPFSVRIYDGQIRKDFKQGFMKARKNLFDTNFELADKMRDSDYLMYLMALGHRYKLFEKFQMVNLDGSLIIDDKEFLKHIESMVNKK